MKNQKAANLTVSELEYHIIPSMPKQASGLEIHNKIFNFWNKQWTANFSQGASPKKGWQDHFIRQDFISAIIHKKNIICCHLYTKYNLNSFATIHSEYFEYIPSEVLNQMRHKGFKSTLTMEYLCVDSQWKKNSLQISFGKALLALGAYLAEDKKIDSVLGMPIYGNKVDNMMDNIGASVLADPINKYGYKLKIMAGSTQPATHGKDKVVRQVTDLLWDRRIDHSSQPTKEQLHLAA